MAHYYHKIVSPWLRTDSKSKTVDLGAFSDKYVDMLKDIQWIGSEKIDGTNLNFYYDGNHVHVYGHTDKSDFKTAYPKTTTFRTFTINANTVKNIS